MPLFLPELVSGRGPVGFRCGTPLPGEDLDGELWFCGILVYVCIGVWAVGDRVGTHDMVNHASCAFSHRHALCIAWVRVIA